MPNQNTPQPNVPSQEPEDMFAPATIPPEVQARVPATLEPPLRPQISQASEARVSPVRAGRGTKMRLQILAVVGVIFLVVLIVFFVVRSRANTPGEVIPQTAPASASVSDPSQVVVPIPDTTTQETDVSEPVRDSDGDGLLDTEESTLGTDPEQLDSDGDGLNDRQEIRVYQTDPNNPDTDSDTFPDGDEVRNFFNPNGSGKMIDESQLIKELNENI